jgi:predicted TIM-barrel fold metal-dependent hydrolase
MKRSIRGGAVVCIGLLLCAAPSAQKANVHTRMSTGVSAIRLIDTHEHLAPEPDRNRTQPSLFSLLHYVSSDMWADGLDRVSEQTLGRASVPLADQWRLVAPYWRNVRTTAYGRNLLRAVRDLYGVTDISETTYAEISRKVAEANRVGWYEHVLRKKAGIDLSICDIGEAGISLDRAMFRAVIRLEQFLIVPQGVMLVEKDQGATITTLAEWEEALDKAVARARDKGFVAIKSAVAYQRSLDFAPVDRAEAEGIFNRARERKVQPGPADWSRDKALQDYMFGRIADACANYDLPLQVHTGLFYDMWRNVTQANPALLAPFIARHRNTRFILMHGGYPYGAELLAMGKNLPNVIVDMCWTYAISPSFASRFLNEAIETLPADKILGFGGDYQVPEGVYAHAMLCREVVAKVLADKVAAGYWSEAEALAFARAILRENPLRVFKLGSSAQPAF